MTFSQGGIVIGLIFLAFVVGYLRGQRKKKIFVPYSEVNQFKPGAFMVGRDVHRL